MGTAVARAVVEAGAHCHVPAIESSVPADRFPKDGVSVTTGIDLSNEMLENDPPIADAVLAANQELQGRSALEVLDAVVAALAAQGLVIILDIEKLFGPDEIELDPSSSPHLIAAASPTSPTESGA